MPPWDEWGEERKKWEEVEGIEEATQQLVNCPTYL
jgi:hypothetical protein